LWFTTEVTVTEESKLEDGTLAVHWVNPFSLPPIYSEIAKLRKEYPVLQGCGHAMQYKEDVNRWHRLSAPEWEFYHDMNEDNIVHVAKTKESPAYDLVRCPHCREIFQVPQGWINCKIFRHAMKKDGTMVDPHASQYKIASMEIRGCGKPVMYDGTRVKKIGYI
jgi:hypothetical protein